MKRMSFLSPLFSFFASGEPALFTTGLAVNAGSLLTWALIGSLFGSHLIWAFLPIAVALLAAQKMSTALGAVTRKGLAGLIRENFRLRTTGLMMTGLLLTDIANLIAQFAGIAASLEIFGFSQYVTVPAAALLIPWIAGKGLYPSVKRISLLSCTLYFLLIAAGINNFSWNQIVPALSPSDFALENDYLTMLLALVGATMAPRILLYSQLAAAEKSVTPADYDHHRRCVLAGGLFTVLLAFFIIIAYTGTLFAHNVDLVHAGSAALVLQPLFGSLAPALFAFILLNASLFSASLIPLSSAYSACEFIGCKAGLDKSRQEAPVFYRFYTCLIIVGALPSMIPDIPLMSIMLWSQLGNGILLPFILFSLLRLSTNRDILGQFANPRIYNGITWISSCLIGILLLILAATSLFPDIFACR